MMGDAGGRARPITVYGTAVLHRACEPVASFGGELHQLIADMFASMYQANGVGLAANQIGIDARVFVFDCPDATGQNLSGHVVNPVLAAPVFAVNTSEDQEGCLSVPGPRALLGRPALAAVTGLDLHGRPLTIVGTGMLARCLQHETDHLNGTVYVDHLPEPERHRVLAEAGLTPR